MNLEVALKTEIEFWQGMIDLKSDDPDPEILERMKMAKQLAELKLSLCSTECEHWNH